MRLAASLVVRDASPSFEIDSGWTIDPASSQRYQRLQIASYRAGTLIGLVNAGAKASTVSFELRSYPSGPVLRLPKTKDCASAVDARTLAVLPTGEVFVAGPRWRSRAGTIAARDPSSRASASPSRTRPSSSPLSSRVRRPTCSPMAGL